MSRLAMREVIKGLSPALTVNGGRNADNVTAIVTYTMLVPISQCPFSCRSHPWRFLLQVPPLTVPLLLP